MNQNIKKALKITLPLLLGVFLVWYSLSKVSFDELLVYIKKADYKWIVLGVCLGLLSHLSRAYRWLFMLEPLGYKIKFGNSVMAVFATYLINYTIPRAGEVARATILTNYEKVPFEKGFGTIVSERIADLIIIFSIVLLTLSLQFDFIYSFLVSKFNLSKIIIGVLLLTIISVLFFVFIKRSHSKFALRVKAFINGLIEGVLSIFKMKKNGLLFSILCLYGSCMCLCFMLPLLL